MKLSILLSLLAPVTAFVAAPSKNLRAESSLNAHNNRRSFLSNAIAGVALSTGLAQPAFAADDLVDVYFGVGCYWHIQHEFVVAERNLLNRADNELTSRTGYAGGTATDKEGRVCYHNFKGVADYGKLGHGEVVGMKIPQNQIGNFAKEYFDLFTASGERVDPMDRGGEYRSLLGLPGGSNNAAYPAVEAAATAKGMTLELGKGNDGDTLGLKKVWVSLSSKLNTNTNTNTNSSTQSNTPLLVESLIFVSLLIISLFSSDFIFGAGL